MKVDRLEELIARERSKSIQTEREGKQLSLSKTSLDHLKAQYEHTLMSRTQELAKAQSQLKAAEDKIRRLERRLGEVNMRNYYHYLDFLETTIAYRINLGAPRDADSGRNVIEESPRDKGKRIPEVISDRREVAQHMESPKGSRSTERRIAEELEDTKRQLKAVEMQYEQQKLNRS
ncbi:hypothetical protein HDU76_007077 [Blyttiomyces sp. JEL0837]|nr:hypothetical protein HDU76_007077 [Blyttiomyces sp. JEL0837]